MLKPEISVILPVYNSEKFIASAIESVLQQTFKNFEFLIINDGSTDNSLSIIQTFEDPRIRVFDKKNTGLIDTLNFGISQSIAPWIARMDQDDICRKDRFETQYKLINNDIAVIGSQALLIDQNSSIYGRTNFATEHNEILNRMEQQFSNVIHPSTLINRSYLEKVGGYDPKMSAAEDFDLWFRISKLGKIVNVNDTLLSLRKHGTNMSSVKIKEAIDNCLISTCYNISSSSYKPMTDENYIEFKALVEKTAVNYKTAFLIFEERKKSFSDLSSFRKIFFLLKNPGILYSYFSMKNIKKKTLAQLKYNLVK